MGLAQRLIYTIDDIYALPEGQRAELIDGQMYNMSPPGKTHQKISGNLFAEIHNYIRKKKGSCEIYAAPFAVFLNDDERNYVEPDISVICDPGKLDEQGCHGAPDWVIEILSPGTVRIDCGIKLFKYRTAGVREYWTINPKLRTVSVYYFEYDEKTEQYSFDDEIPGCIYEDLLIRISDLL